MTDGDPEYGNKFGYKTATKFQSVEQSILKTWNFGISVWNSGCAV